MEKELSAENQMESESLHLPPAINPGEELHPHHTITISHIQYRVCPLCSSLSTTTQLGALNLNRTTGRPLGEKWTWTDNLREMNGSAGQTQESYQQKWAGRENNWTLKIRGLKDYIPILHLFRMWPEK